MSRAKTKRVRYSGPAFMSCPEIAVASDGGAALEPGEVYELPAELADSLVSSSAWFELVRPKRVRPKRKRGSSSSPIVDEDPDQTEGTNA